jgi:hypothetical protein
MDYSYDSDFDLKQATKWLRGASKFISVVVAFVSVTYSGLCNAPLNDRDARTYLRDMIARIAKLLDGVSDTRADLPAASQGWNEHALGSIPATRAGCPTSRSFFARCGIPQAFPSSRSRVPQLHTGAPCSHQRTWAENDGRSPTTAFRPVLTTCSLGPERSEVDGSAVRPADSPTLSWQTTQSVGCQCDAPRRANSQFL